jgi:hypothetical protein
MTEAEWNDCCEPQKMLEFLRERGGASERKLRLFAVACCRRIWHLLADERSRRAVELAERFADGEAGREELDAAVEAAGAVSGEAEAAAEEADAAAEEAAWAAVEPADAAWATLRAAIEDTAGDVWEKAAWAATRAAGAATRAAGAATEAAERKAQAALFRDIFGNLFRPLPPLRAYNDATVQRLAQAAYDDRLLPFGHLDPSRLAVLADALLDAGRPADAEILLHLRGEGPHWHGCHVLDAILGRG